MIISKPLIMFVVGLVTGGSIGTAAGALYFKKKYEKEYDEAIDEMEEYYQKVDTYKKGAVSEEEVNPSSKYVRNSETENGRDKGPLSAEEREAIREKLNKNWEMTTNYAAMFTGGEPDDDEEDSPQVFNENGNPVSIDVEATEYHAANRDRGPIVVEESEIGQYPAYFDHETFFFYPKAGILTDEENREIMDPETFLGDNLTESGFDEDDEERLFVVNFRLDTIFEVQKLDGDAIPPVY